MDEPIAPRFVPALVRNLLTADDEMEGHSHAAVQRALGLFIVRGVDGAEEAWAAAGESASDEQRGTLFKVWWFLSQLVDPDRGWQGEEPKLSDEDRQQLRARIFETSMLRLAGGWGYDVAGQAADIILDLARDAPIGPQARSTCSWEGSSPQTARPTSPDRRCSYQQTTYPTRLRRWSGRHGRRS
ncbi:hypothetical protein P9139_11150 [Curtobacterium flaccumfaciens]|nr:hypothetical protein P9139_11150 [Curtobacterium flaccumfaciens]